MNILHINTSADQGGAAKAMQRLHQGLRQSGQQSQILAKYKTKDDRNVFLVNEVVRDFWNIARRKKEGLFRLLDKHTGLFYWFYSSTFLLAQTEIFKQSDIINFHNLHGSYFNLLAIPLLSEKKPIVWTLHDMWPLTGHCTYSYDCQRWIKGCFKCPLLRDRRLKLEYPPATVMDLTKNIWQAKQNIYKKSNLHIITPSSWMQSLVKESILNKSILIEHIPWGIDLEKFYPVGKKQARQMLGIAEDKKVVIFVSESLSQYRKGASFLVSALERLQNEFSICLLLIGSGAVTVSNLEKISLKKFDYVDSEDLLRLFYSAADVLALPTLADNQPLVLIEAMACGTPAVAFDIGGIHEIIKHMDNGYLAAYKEIEALAAGIKLLLKDENLSARLSMRCRQTAERDYSLQLQTRRYLSFYESVKRHN